MNRFRTSYLGKSREASSSTEKDANDLESTASTIVREEPLKPPTLKIKRVDWYYSRWSKSWKYRNTSSKVVVEAVPIIKTGDNDQWKEYSFVIVRTIPREEGAEPTFKVVIKSEYLLKALKDVVVSWPGVSWNAEPLEIEPEMFLTFYDEFVAYRNDLQAKKPRTEHENHVLSTVNVLLAWLESDYSNTLARIKHLKAHGEMTFDLLYSILVPRSLIVTECAVTAQPRVFRLVSTSKVIIDKALVCYQLSVESIDLLDRVVTQTVAVGKAGTSFFLQGFKGTVKINSLDAYPLKYHKDHDELRKTLIERGKKWKSLIGIHHVQFDGIAAMKCGQKLLRHNVKGRIMIDRASFKRWNANYQFPTAVQNTENNVPNPQNPHQMRDLWPGGQEQQQTVTADQYANGNLVVNRNTSNAAPTDDEFDWTDEALILTSTLVYGFSLSDKMWLEFDVTKVSDIVWNEEAFANLVLPTTHKSLLQSLVEAHHRGLGFDDFIKGKGHGLVINLFGPPGVGKTFSAEATSEHVRKPLYLVGAGDLGIEAGTMDTALDRVFQIATTWKAIVLIDEADVFLEQRSLHELQRNAMVAVFLRHVEYYRGILFLTTNRVTAFDEAFLSRIHVALHFTELPVESRAQVWKAFISKAGEIEITDEQLHTLALRNVNGRQIKNATRTAQSLASGRGEKLNFQHFIDTLDAMHDFTTQFENMNGTAKPVYYS